MRTKILFILLCALTVTNPVKSQKSKIAYINTNVLWQLMPEKAAADSILNMEKLDLQKYYTEQTEDLKAKVQALNNDPNFDETKLIYQQKNKDIQDRYKELETFISKAERELQAKQNQLYKPIREKMEDAINSVAEENGYEYVLDSSFGNIIYRKSETYDILEKVKNKLKLN